MKVTREILEQRFRDGLKRRLEELEQLAGDRDFSNLYRAFHSLAGIGGTYGHFDITLVAREGEMHAQTHDLARTRAAIRALAEIRERLCRRDVEGGALVSRVA